MRGVAEQTQRDYPFSHSLSHTRLRRPICSLRSGNPRFPNPINQFLNLFSFHFLRPCLFPGKTYDVVNSLCSLFLFSFGPFDSRENSPLESVKCVRRVLYLFCWVDYIFLDEIVKKVFYLSLHLYFFWWWLGKSIVVFSTSFRCIYNDEMCLLFLGKDNFPENMFNQL